MYDSQLHNRQNWLYSMTLLSWLKSCVKS